MGILLGVLIFYLGLIAGFLLRMWLNRFRDYSGVMFVTREEGKTLYSLMLDDYPEKLEFKKHVHFQVVQDSEESPNRE